MFNGFKPPIRFFLQVGLSMFCLTRASLKICGFCDGYRDNVHNGKMGSTLHLVADLSTLKSLGWTLESHQEKRRFSPLATTSGRSFELGFFSLHPFWTMNFPINHSRAVGNNLAGLTMGWRWKIGNSKPKHGTASLSTFQKQCILCSFLKCCSCLLQKFSWVRQLSNQGFCTQVDLQFLDAGYIIIHCRRRVYVAVLNSHFRFISFMHVDPFMAEKWWI